MKTYSVSFTALLIGLMAVSGTLPNLGSSLVPTNRTGNVVTKAVRPFGGSLSGSWPAGQGYHTYGYYSLDVSGIPNGSLLTINYQAGDTPNRFILQDGCGNSALSHNNSNNPDPYNGYVGYATYAGPWGMSGISGPTNGTVSILKTSGCTNYTLQVETSTNPATDYWQVTY